MFSNASDTNSSFSNHSRSQHRYDRDAWNASRLTLYSAFIALGGPVNLWIMLALLTCAKLRASPKIRLICSMLLIQITEAWIVYPTLLAYRGYRFGRSGSACHIVAVFTHLPWIQDFVDNWALVLLLVLFLAQIIDFRSKLTNGVMSIILPAAPWVASLIVIPVIARAHRPKEDVPCEYEDAWDSWLVFGSLCTAVPLSLSLLLVGVAAVLRFQRFSARKGLPGAATVEMLSGGPQVDTCYPYAIVVLVACAFDVPFLLMKFDLVSGTSINVLVYYLTTRQLMNCRLLFMPLAILAFPDVRERVKTWRPCCPKPAPGIDLTVRYRQDQTD